MGVHRPGGANNDSVSEIAVDAEGNSVVTGRLSGSATFGAGEPNETVLISAGFQDIFVAKFNGDNGGRPGDINKDGCVDHTDANIVLNNVRAGSDDPDYDVNEDGIVNRADGRAVVSLFDNPDGAPCK